MTDPQVWLPALTALGLTWPQLQEMAGVTWAPQSPKHRADMLGSFVYPSPPRGVSRNYSLECLALSSGIRGNPGKARERHVACRQPPSTGRNHAGRDLPVHHGWVAAVLAPCLTCTHTSLEQESLMCCACWADLRPSNYRCRSWKERQGHSPDSGVSNYKSQNLQRSSWPAFVYTCFYVYF